MDYVSEAERFLKFSSKSDFASQSSRVQSCRHFGGGELVEEAFVRKVGPRGNVGLLGVSSRMSIA